ncbi:MAG: protein translocase subunit SecF [Nitrospirota bacterium]|jgi:preprotein translocase subunit SecF
MIEFIKKPNIDFMGKRPFAFAFSGLLVALGIFSLIQVARGAANLGIDFAGGTSVQIKFKETVPLQNIRSALERSGLKDFDLQDLPTENKILIRVKKKEETLGGFSEKIVSTLKEDFAAQKPVVDSTTEIGPKVGDKLRKDALFAIVAATIGILIYVAFRFQFRFAVGATTATFHDVLAVFGIFYLLGKEVNLILVSALLMIAGYSLTDTVVVFDRIRENLRSRYRENINKVINLSINEVLSRTVIVSFTTLLAALALFIFGGEVIHDFSLAIILGIIIGTYSSIFVASPVVLLWKSKKLLGKR